MHRVCVNTVWTLCLFSAVKCVEERMDNVIGESLDIFANFGDLSQTMQVISGDEDDNMIFTEKTMQVFDKSGLFFSSATRDRLDSISFQFSDTFDDLMTNYYSHFEIEGTDKPWKTFMGDWTQYDILSNLGVTLENSFDTLGYCCFVLTRMSKVHQSLTAATEEDDLLPTKHVSEAARNMNSSDRADIRRFMRSYGTHYISSYATGNSVYQVFVYTPVAYRALKRQMRHRKNSTLYSDDLRFFTSSFFLRQIGRVMVASGNKTIEDWCNLNLRDGHFLYTRPTLLKLYNNSTLLNNLSGMLDNGALLQMKFKIMSPVFRDVEKRSRFIETVDNDLKLWEVTS